MNRPGQCVDKLRASEIHADTLIRVITIEAIYFNAEKFGLFYQVYGYIEPIALVICEAGDNRVINLTPVETSLEELKRNVPELHALLG